ncbi:MAG: alpha/beta hydrolase-fold protein [Candidatus Korobacteraceae bacterium]
MKSILRSIAVLAFLGALVSMGMAQGSGQSKIECSALQSRILHRPVPYCVLLPPSYAQDKVRRYPVAYYLHGLGDNEQSLVNLGGWALYDKLLSEKKIGEFVIVAPAGFASFYINSKNGKLRYEDFFLQEFMPAMEKKYRIGTTAAQRGVMGVSMGGYGALHYAFKYPDKFAVVSANIPALFEGLPRELTKDWLGAVLADVFGNPPDMAFFEDNSPFHLARSAPAEALRRMKIYFDGAELDRYGFDSGTRALDKLLTERSIAHEAHVYPGAHDWQFLQQHFAASLEAQSAGLGAK